MSTSVNQNTGVVAETINGDVDITVKKNIRINSAIENLLEGLFNVVEDPSFSPPSFNKFELEKKIKYNQIERYRNFIEDYLNAKNIIRSKLNTLQNIDESITLKIIQYVQKKFRDIFNAELTSDGMINKLIKVILNDLKEHSTIALEEIEVGADYLVFYVFSECKIFDIPPAGFE